MEPSKQSGFFEKAFDKDDFDRAGYAVLSEAINADTIEALIEGIEAAGANDFSYKRGQERYAMRNLLETTPEVRSFAESPLIRGIVEPILGAEAFAVRGLLFDKTPSANWKVTWHQDLTITVKERLEVPGYGPWSVKAGIPHVQPPATVLENMLTVRLHLDDCTIDNGPLRVLPGSHLSRKLGAEEIQQWRRRVAPENCVVGRGGILLMRPLLLHASATARQPGHRRVVHLEYSSAELDGNLQWHTAVRRHIAFSLGTAEIQA